jgi:hypothetical protein
MLPISEIKEGDLFTNPLFVNTNQPGNIYRVEKVNVSEKMVCVQCYSGSEMKPIGRPFWKKNTDRMFSEDWRFI